MFLVIEVEIPIILSMFKTWSISTTLIHSLISRRCYKL